MRVHLLGIHSRQTRCRHERLKPLCAKGQTQQIWVYLLGCRFCRKSYGICWVSGRLSTEGSITWVEKLMFSRPKSQQAQGFEACRGISHFAVPKRGQNGTLRFYRFCCNFRKILCAFFSRSSLLRSIGDAYFMCWYILFIPTFTVFQTVDLVTP